MSEDFGWDLPPGCLDSDIAALSESEEDEMDDQRESGEWHPPETADDEEA